ncbi:MAG TPA: hypothetical protein VF528_05495 [Pyrinomonadaceae bacterium]|jgi:hypothetical protein
MKNLKLLLVASLVFTLLALPSFNLANARNTIDPQPPVVSQSNGALERGYRTGYSDGYQAGYRDSVQRAARDYRNKEDYQRGDRAYAPSYGAIEDYRDGYQQGFEVGYADGYERRTFKSDIPNGLSRRDPANTQDDDDASAGISTSTSTGSTNSTSGNNNSNNTGPGMSGGIYDIPANTVMRVELLTNLSTEATQRGDRFQARVLEPSEYEGAILDGRVTRVKRAGKVSGRAELQLTFDHIRFTDNRGANFEAQVIEVIDMGGSEGVGDVDEEGGVKGKSTTKDDVAKVGATTGIGAIIGAIAGGGKGAAIGAAIGGAIGTGGVLSQRGKDIRMPQGQQMRIRTSSQTRIQ